MPSLRTEGFTDLVADAAHRARMANDGGKLVQAALTLDGRVEEVVGLLAVTSADRVVLDLVRAGALTVDVGADGPDRVMLTDAGRVTVRLDGATHPVDLHRLGALRWDGVGEAEVKARVAAEVAATATHLARVHRELVALPRDQVLERVGHIEYCLLHMAPVLIHTNDRVYTNLGKGNLPGKSTGAGHPRSLLNQLRATEVAEWAPEHACFVACLAAVLASGPPVRAEEFNGAQLCPSTVDDFLSARIAAYGGAVPEAPAVSLAELESRAQECQRLREKATSAGLRPYRVINGLNLHKAEHLADVPALLGSVPRALREHLAEVLGAELPERIDALAPLWTEFTARLRGTEGTEPYTTAFEGALHGLLTAIAEAFYADVSMSRGPERFDPLRIDHGGTADPLDLGTGDFYCCVTPRKAFVDRFSDEPEDLAKTLSAYSARMRFNTWHYLPHTLGIVEREPGRDDWFFAPTMPDVTQWSDQHHTGHMAFGVRYAIRVPFGITYDGRALPGLYDLRLLRVSAPTFTVADLRGAIAAGEVLRGFYQAMSVHEPVVTDFGRDWYRRVHG